MPTTSHLLNHCITSETLTKKTKKAKIRCYCKSHKHPSRTNSIDASNLNNNISNNNAENNASLGADNSFESDSLISEPMIVANNPIAPIIETINVLINQTNNVSKEHFNESKQSPTRQTINQSTIHNSSLSNVEDINSPTYQLNNQPIFARID